MLSNCRSLPAFSPTALAGVTPHNKTNMAEANAAGSSTTARTTHDIGKALREVQATVTMASKFASHPVRLVAVSKKKPPQDILEAYKQGQCHFGENYVQELVDKASSSLLVYLPNIRWHFIGHLQRNKCNNVLSIPHIWCVETVDSDRLATALDASWGKKQTDPSQKLHVFVQVNTSGEASKSGCDPDTTAEIVHHVLENCFNLEFKGLMTIGRFGHDYTIGSNPDFEALVATRRQICQSLSMSEEDCELSMGMSADYEEAIKAGSTNVRVGSTIFGARELKKTM